MEGKAKFVFPILATGIVVFVVTFIAFPYVHRATTGIVALIERG
jgi:hypothetical protein